MQFLDVTGLGITADVLGEVVEACRWLSWDNVIGVDGGVDDA